MHAQHVDSGALGTTAFQRPAQNPAARHIEGEAGKQDATAPNDVDCDEGQSMETVIRDIDFPDAPKQSAVEVVDWTRAAYGRCPRQLKHTRRRDPTWVDQSANFAGTTTGQTRHSPTADHDAKIVGPVINRTNNSGGLVRNAVSVCDGPKLGNEVKAEIHEVRRDKTEVEQLADLSGTMKADRPRYRGAAAGATAGKTAGASGGRASGRKMQPTRAASRPRCS